MKLFHERQALDVLRAARAVVDYELPDDRSVVCTSVEVDAELWAELERAVERARGLLALEATRPAMNEHAPYVHGGERRPATLREAFDPERVAFQPIGDPPPGWDEMDGLARLEYCAREAREIATERSNP